MSYPVFDRRGIKTFKIELVRASLLSEVGVFTDIELEFSEIPERVLVQKSAVYTDVPIPGRSEPWKNYSHSNPTTITFTAKLVAIGAPTSGSLGAAAGSAAVNLAFAGLSVAGVPTSVNVNIPEVGEDANFLGIPNNAINRVEALANAAQNIPLILLECQRKADWLRALLHPQHDSQGRVFPPPLVNLIHGANFTMRGVIKDVNLTYMSPWEPNTLLSQQIEVNITFEEVNDTPKGYLEVRNGWNPQSGGANRFRPSATDMLQAARSVSGI